MIGFLLSGCAGGGFDTKKSTSLLLPQVAEYEQSLLRGAANEIENGQCRALTELAKDYYVTREKLRIAKEELDA